MKCRRCIALIIGVAAWSTISASAWAQSQSAPPELNSALIEAQAQRMRVMADAASATIAVFGSDGAGGGSGVIFSPDGYALTNFHVAQPCGDYMRCGLSDGKLYDAVIVGLDPTGDVALIKLLGRDDFPVAPLGNSDNLQVGQTCFAAGNPFLLATDFQPTITTGIISGVHRYQYPANTLLEYADCIQTDAAINPGNSGGPLFDEFGNVIGINGRISIEKRGRVNVGVGYAISINQIKKFMGYLRSGRIVDHATLGFTVSSDETGKVVVSNMLESSDAYRRGIRYDDEIMALAGREVHSANALQNIIGTFPRGWRIPVVFRRNNEEFEVNIRLAGVHSAEELIAMLDKKPPQQRPKKPGKQPDDPEDAPPDDDNELERDTPDDGGRPLEESVKKKQKIPAAVKAIFEQRRGFANYYFNRINVERIYSQLKKQFEFADSTERSHADWRFSGTLATGGAFQITLADDEAEADLPSGMWNITTSDDLDAQLTPDGSGGLLVALHLLRELINTGPKMFGDVYYLGTAPLAGSDIHADVLIAVREAVELRLHTHPANGRLLAIELFADTREDPCEVFFEFEKEVPRTLTVRHGDDLYGVFRIKRMIGDYVE
jgi:S1-C subfamily serine protease